jgi:hypothetical protein
LKNGTNNDRSQPLFDLNLKTIALNFLDGESMKKVSKNLVFVSAIGALALVGTTIIGCKDSTKETTTTTTTDVSPAPATDATPVAPSADSGSSTTTEKTTTEKTNN